MTSEDSTSNASSTPNTVAEDTPCRKCSYNLRGQDTKSLCPECGSPVELSLFTNLLKYSQPQWVKLLSGAVTLLLWSVGILPAIFVAEILTRIHTRNNPRLTITSYVLQFVYALTYIAWWLLTTPDPSGLGEDKYGLSRNVIRATLPIGFIDLVLRMGRVPSQTPAVRYSILGFHIFGELAMLVCLFAQLWYLQKLSQRIPDEKLISGARKLQFSLPGSLLVYTLVAEFPFARLFRLFPSAYLVVVGLCVLGTLFLLIYYFRILWRLNTQLKIAAKLAEVHRAQYDTDAVQR